MDDDLKDYTDEEIKQLATLALKNDEIKETVPLKIEKIDKEYKIHNKKAVTRGLFNASIILIGSYIMLTNESDISNLGIEELNIIVNKYSELLYNFTKDEYMVNLFLMTFDKLVIIIEKIGVIGLFLFSNSINFILSTFKDCKISLKLKKELSELKSILEKMDEDIKIK